MPPRTATDRIPKAERTRRQILAAAERRFADAGFADTRLDDIAADVGLVGSAILYHYGDKRGLYDAVSDDLTANLVDAVEVAVAGEAPPRMKLLALVRTSARVVASRPALASLVLREALDHDRQPDAEQHGNPLLERIVELFDAGVREGDIHPVRNEPNHFFSAVAGAILFYVAALPYFATAMPEDHLSPEQIDRLEEDAVAIAERLLGIAGPHPL